MQKVQKFINYLVFKLILTQNTDKSAKKTQIFLFYSYLIALKILHHCLMTQNNSAITLLAIVLVTGSLLYLNSGNFFEGLSSQNNLKCIAISTIISRGQDWVTKNVPYNHDGTHDGYRTDCSGFVSMSWQLAKPGLTTFTLHIVSHSVDKSVVQPGDAMICEEHHVVLYAGWADSAKTHYIGMEEVDPARGTIKRTIPYPYFSNTTCFHPIRYNNVC